ncbi:hypothetical protein NUM3379_38730 [Kineococcus sp. NUM-3379]
MSREVCPGPPGRARPDRCPDAVARASIPRAGAPGFALDWYGLRPGRQGFSVTVPPTRAWLRSQVLDVPAPETT